MQRDKSSGPTRSLLRRRSAAYHIAQKLDWEESGGKCRVYGVPASLVVLQREEPTFRSRNLRVVP
jgi:hypothetical protein